MRNEQAIPIFIPVVEDGSEGVYIKPFTQDTLRQAQENALKHVSPYTVDMVHMAKDKIKALVAMGKFLIDFAPMIQSILFKETLSSAIVDWKGFKDAEGQEMPYTKEVLEACIECDKRSGDNLFPRILDQVFEISQMLALNSRFPPKYYN